MYFIENNSILYLLCMALGGLFLFLAWFTQRKAKKVITWPTTQGTVTKSILKVEDQVEGGNTYHPYVKYSYQVKNQKYAGDNFQAGALPGINSHARMQKELNPYPEGGVVPVYYNPLDPKESYLKPGTTDVGILYFLGGGFLLYGIYHL